MAFLRRWRGNKQGSDSEPVSSDNAQTAPLPPLEDVTDSTPEVFDSPTSLPPVDTPIAIGATRPLPAEPIITQVSGHLTYGQTSDQGVVRLNNQDAALSYTFTSDSSESRPDFGLFIVADGMGGHQDGEKASAITARVVATEILNKIFMPMLGEGSLEHDADRPTIAETLTNAVKIANAKVLESIADAGTTVTAMVIIGRIIHIAHVGDSRAYLIYKDGEIEQITRDHSLVQRLIELNQLTVEDSHTHPQRNVLYRAVGLNDVIEVDILTRRLYAGSYVLLCSDGLWGFVPEADMSQVIRSTPDPQEACNKLVSMANENGGNDNITAILLKIPAK